ncbi:unnamed protein product [uncultured bacterium]|nr:unnamed protein product [uncultured bacterium]
MTTRFALFVAALAGLLSFAGTQAQPPAEVPVAPPPREVRPDGSRPPVPPPPKTEDPAVVIARIVKNSNDVGDRLSKTDPGPQTQKTQAEILKDIDSLLNPPPSGGGGADKKDQKNPDPNQQKKDDMKSSGGGMDKQPNPDPKGDGRPDQAARPRKNDQQAKANPPNGKDQKPPQDPDMNQQAKGGGMDPKKEPGPMPGGGMKEPMPKEKTDPNASPMSPSGGTPNGPIRTGPPFLVDDGKQQGTVGSRDKERKQVDQFRSDKDMRGYANLLEAYYAHLAGGGK